MEIKKFDNLYKRASNGKFVVYELGVFNRMGEVTILKHTGYIDGTLIKHEETIKEGLQGRNIKEQGIFNAESDYRKKKDEGYKSLIDLGNPTNELFGIKIEVFLNAKLPKYNTDANGNVKPMLAQSLKDQNKLDFSKVGNVYVQPKLDGARCLTIIKGSEITFLSRGGKEYQMPHIRKQLLDYQEKYGLLDIVLDGELYSDNLTFQEIISAVKKLNTNTIQIQYRCYDMVLDLPFSQRYKNLVLFYAGKYETIPSIKLVYTYLTNETLGNVKAYIKEKHDEFVLEYGYEGAMVRLDTKPNYECGKRSKSLLKVKEFDETEFEIVGGKINKETLLQVPDVINNEVIDSFTFICATDDGGLFDPKPMGSRSQRKEYIEKLFTLIGKKATVKHFGYTDDYLPRHAQVKIVRDYE